MRRAYAAYVTSAGGGLLTLLGWLVLVFVSTQASAQEICIGDCDSDGAVSIAELVIGVNIALARDALQRCSGFDTNDDGSLQINELLGGVRSSLQGCRLPDPTPTPTPEEFVAEAADFECLKNWTRIRRFRITNALGYLDEALAVAHGDAPPPYPVGTIIQLVPMEAMVKRGAGFFPEANDWEFFVLSASGAGTEIVKRGRGEVTNIGPIACFACHSAAPQKDLVCETGNGCIALSLSEDLINLLQERDPRCPAQ